MKKIILDGYNVIHAIPQLERRLDKSLRDAREALANFMVDWQKNRSYKGDICIVFDGKDDGYHTAHDNIAGVHCVYTTTKQDADGYIVSMVKEARDPASVTVVSNDNYVANNSRAHGARIKPVDFLLTAPKKTAKPEETKNIDAKTAAEINSFLRKKWGL
ncbi:MAG: NYN domain-containing protein [Candidatus Omnitrophica bacterium]|nr:NYN domain-containing protein [Candidatus Omnitrophota bacterium]